MANHKHLTKVMRNLDKQGSVLTDKSPGPTENADRIQMIKFDRYQALFIAVLVLVGAAIYANTLHSPFYLDDLDAIQDNSFIRMEEISVRNLIDAAVGYGKNRPVAMLTFAFNYYFGEYNVVGYHLVNIFIHLINGILLFSFVKLTLTLSNRQTSTGRKLDPITVTTLSFFTALLWLVNPVQTQSVTYIVQRMNSMGAMFYILALILYAKGRIAQQITGQESDARSRHYYFWFAGCCAAGLLALGSKESTAMLPVFIFLYEWYFFQDLNSKWLKRQLKYLLAVAILIGFLAGMYLGFDPSKKFTLLRDYVLGEFTIGERLLTQARVVIYYLSLIFYPNPSRLNLDHDFPLSYNLFNPFTTFLSIIIIGGLIVLSLYLAKRHRLISFCIFWFLGNLVIESSVIPLAIIFEHRIYLPSMLVILLTVTLFYRYLKPGWLIVGLACISIAICAYWTFERNKIWQDRITLWTDCIKKSPGKARPYANLGAELTNLERYDEALQSFNKAIQISPNLVQAQYNLGLLYERQDQPDKAMEQYRKAIQVNPNFVRSYNNLGVLHLTRDEPDEALKYFQRVQQLKPNVANTYINIGLALSKQGKLDAAVLSYTEALKINSNVARSQFQLGAALLRLGQTRQGVHHIKRSLEIDPDYAEAHNNMGGRLLQQGKMDEALEHLNRALSINPELAEAHNNVGIILIQQGNYEAAIAHFQDALRIDPEFEMAKSNLQRALAIRNERHPEAEGSQTALKKDPEDPQLHYQMGNSYLRKGKIVEAIAEFESALAMKPEFPVAQNNLALAYAANHQNEQALAAFKKLIELDPANTGAYYNIAVLYALQNKVPEAIDWLKQAVDKGYSNWRLIKNDKDLANIRDSEEYKKLVEGH